MSESIPQDRLEFCGQGIQNTGTLTFGGDFNNFGGPRTSDDDILRKIRLTDPRDDKTRIEEQKGGLLYNSYNWILHHQDFQKWREGNGGQLLWISGDPGKGKTMLLCGIIDELDKARMNDGNINTAYYFCQANHSQLNKATCVLRGLIYSLLSRQREFLSYVREEIDQAGEERFQDLNGWASLSRIFGLLVDEIHKRQQTTCLIIDALDECLDGQAALLHWIAKLSSSHVKILVSSRNWHSIESGLSGATHKVPLHLELNADAISGAVYDYIDHKVIELGHSKNLDVKDQEAVRQYLKSNSNNTFLWVALICRRLNHENTHPWEVLETLQCFPPGLDELYSRMAMQFLDSKDSKICCQVLAVQSLVYRPLSLTELPSYLELPAKLIPWLPKIIGLCGSFLGVRDDMIYFVHQSAKEYLIDKMSESLFQSGPLAEHYTIAVRSIKGLSRTLKQNIYSLPSLGCRLDSIDIPSPDPLYSIRYACVHWVDHLEDAKLMGEQDLHDDGLVHRFLRIHLLHWFEALSLLRDVGSGIVALAKILRLMPQAIDRDKQELHKLVYDASRLLQQYKTGIETAPLQVYSTALVFSPTRSVVRELFLKKDPEWLLMNRTGQNNWGPCLQILEGHHETITSVAWSPNGKYVASVSSNSIRVWDVGIGKCLHMLKHHDEDTSMVFSPNSDYMASISVNGIIRIWSITTGEYLHVLESGVRRLTRPCNIIAFLDNMRIIVVHHSGWVSKWNIITGECLETFQMMGEPRNGFTSICLSRNGMRAAWFSRQRESIRVMDIITGQYHDTPWCQNVLRSPLSRSRIALSSNGKYLAAFRNRYVRDEIHLLNICAAQVMRSFQLPNDWKLHDMTFSPDDRFLIAQTTRAVIEWEITGKTEGKYYDLGEKTYSLMYSPDSNMLVSSSDELVRVWDMPAVRRGDPMPAEAVINNEKMIISPDGKRLSFFNEHNDFEVWDLVNKLRIKIGMGHDNLLSFLVRFLPDSNYMVTISRIWQGDKAILISLFDTITGCCLRTVEQETYEGFVYVYGPCFSADGTQLAAGKTVGTRDVQSYHTEVQTWESVTGNHIATVLFPAGQAMSAFAFSPDSTKVAVILNKLSKWRIYKAQIWDVATNSYICSLTLPPLGSHGYLSFSPDSKYVALKEDDRDIAYIIDVITGTQIKTLEGFYNVFRRASPHRPIINSQDSKPRWEPEGLFTSRGILDTQQLLNDPRDRIKYGEEDIYTLTLSGIGISTKRDWILRNGKPYIWIPPGYRSRIMPYHQSQNTIVLSDKSGQIFCIQLPLGDC
ncbi:hypothetical protein F4679DRAFT_439968 [Xylaria curta]|nr:hypothetical protein F4679DRAFT_439968 [Xylaria curta]